MNVTPDTTVPRKNGPLMDWRQLLRALRYVATGKLRLADGHLPVNGQTVPADFVGVGVSTGADPAIDDYLLQQLNVLGLKQVRLDFSYNDPDGPVSRFLEKLLAADFSVLLHLVQPFSEAQQMQSTQTQQRWQAFVAKICLQYGDKLRAIEIGATSNRRHWSGYDTESFFHTWRIAHDVIRHHGITLAGPNISDFEPLHNIAVLSRLRKEARLPDIHTNNLFSERVIEPERYDHRILGKTLAPKLKVNLVKKARLLRKVTEDYGVKAFMSPAAFWTLPRISRQLIDAEQKQADYLSRYMTLLAASGALQQAFWGPLLCNREGLIDDASGQYPALERITHYASVIGDKPEQFRLRPAFLALKHFNKVIPGSVYQGVLATADNLEVHAFMKADCLVHVLWTLNGKAMALNELYDVASLSNAKCSSRDGQLLESLPEFVGESPIYLNWASKMPFTFTYPGSKALTAQYYYFPGKQLYQYDHDGWQGLLYAGNVAEADVLRQQLAPARIRSPENRRILRKARNIIWQVDDLLSEPFIVKMPLRIPWQKRFLDRFKPSKAKRSWIAAAELLRRGIKTARPIAYFEKNGDYSMMQNIYLCERVDHDFTAREMLTAFHDGATIFRGVNEQQAYIELSAFLNDLHARGVFFRDLAGGNILIKKQSDGRLQFTLIDINRARFFNRNATPGECLSDLARLCHKLHWAGRDKFIGEYLAGHRKLPKKFSWRLKLPFYLYDFKANFKRRYGRRALKRLWQSFKKTDNNS